MEDLEYEDREIVIGVLHKAISKLTNRQLQCLLLCWLGFTQEEVGTMLNMTQQGVNDHFLTTLAHVEMIAKEYLL